LAHILTCLLMPCHTKRAVTIFRELLIPGCVRLWMASKTARRHERGTMGLAVPVKVSHSKVVSVPGMGTSARSTNGKRFHTERANILHNVQSTTNAMLVAVNVNLAQKFSRIQGTFSVKSTNVSLAQNSSREIIGDVWRCESTCSQQILGNTKGALSRS